MSVENYKPIDPESLGQEPNTEVRFNRRAFFTSALAAYLALRAGKADAGTSVIDSLTGPEVAKTPETIARFKIHYEANGGRPRIAYVLLPAWYDRHNSPPLPLVIAPHGRGVGPFLGTPRAWGELPALGPFAAVFPEGQGRSLGHHSWGYPGQIDDLARMPEIVQEKLPWLRVDPHSIFAVGGSMGGQEALLLVARYPHLLAGAVAFDAPTNLSLRYKQFGYLSNGESVRKLMRYEVGGTPDENPDAYAERSPLHFAREIALSDVPLQIWWSTRDQLIPEQPQQSGLLFSEIKRQNPEAPVVEVVGTWPHSAEMRWDRRLPDALRFLGLDLPPVSPNTTPASVAPANARTPK